MSITARSLQMESTAAMQERLLSYQRRLKAEYSQDNIFHGIIFEDMVEDVIERDGNKPFKMKDPINDKKSAMMVPEIRRKPSFISLRKFPHSDSSGIIELAEDSSKKTIEFYHGKKFLEANDSSIELKIVFSEVPDAGKFNPQLVSKEKDEYFLENLDDHYVCLAPGNDPKLTSLKKDEIAARGKTVVSKITIFKTTKTQGSSNIALFFCVKEKSKVFNYYLVPQESSDAITIKRIEVTRLSDDDIVEEHRKFLLFSTEYLNPDNDEDENDDDDIDAPKLQLDTQSMLSTESVKPPTIVPVTSKSDDSDADSGHGSCEKENDESKENGHIHPQ